MEKYLITILLLINYSFVFGQCGVFAETQNELDSFFINYPFCDTDSLNSIRIEGSDISDLSILNSVQHIELIIIRDTELYSLEGLNNVSSVDYLQFYNNPNLSDISALNKVDSLQSLDFTFNSQIEDLSPFNFLNHLTRLSVFENGYLDGLGSIISQTTSSCGIQVFDNNYENDLSNIFKQSETEIGFLTFRNSSKFVLNGIDNVEYCSTLAFDNCKNLILGNTNLIQNIDAFQISNMDINEFNEDNLLPNIDSLYTLNLENVSELNSLDNILRNIKSISRHLFINSNPDLIDISRINCLEPPNKSTSWNNLEIRNNPKISDCESYLSCKAILTIPNKVLIEENGQDCNEQYLVSNCDLSLESYISNFSFRIIPNPAMEQVKLEVNKINGELNYIIYNTLGQEISNGKYEDYIYVQTFPPGTYFLQLRMNENALTKKLIIHK